MFVQASIKAKGCRVIFECMSISSLPCLPSVYLFCCLPSLSLPSPLLFRGFLYFSSSFPTFTLPCLLFSSVLNPFDMSFPLVSSSFPFHFLYLFLHWSCYTTLRLYLSPHFLYLPLHTFSTLAFTLYLTKSFHIAPPCQQEGDSI